VGLDFNVVGLGRRDHHFRSRDVGRVILTAGGGAQRLRLHAILGRKDIIVVGKPWFIYRLIVRYVLRIENIAHHKKIPKRPLERRKIVYNHLAGHGGCYLAACGKIAVLGCDGYYSLARARCFVGILQSGNRSVS